MPTVIPSERPTEPPPTPTETATEVPPTPSPVPPTPGEGTVYGPIVPPDYTPAPTFTPKPPETPGIIEPGPTTVPGVTPTPPPRLNRELVGIQIHPQITREEWDNMMHWAASLNVRWLKVQFPWDEMEPDGPGSQSEYWRRLELYMQDANSRGFKVMVSVTKAPDWARPTNEENGPPTDPQLLSGFLEHILSRFGTSIHAIEVWNEPNLRREWNGSPINGQQYMRLFDAAYRTITAWSQENGHPITVVTAGLAPTGTSDFSLDDRIFLRQMYQAGLAGYAGVAVGMHPYGWGNAPSERCCNNVEGRGWDDDPHFFFLDTIEAYRQIMLQFGDTDAELWGTEFGWATYDGFGAPAPQPFFDYVNEELQARYIVEALDILQNSGNYDYVGVMILWNLNFATIEGATTRGEEQAGYSLLRPDLSRRPAYSLLHQALNG
ncbi:MAG: cellulase family glycosylhydrolase [Anaerolineae bacterium]